MSACIPSVSFFRTIFYCWQFNQMLGFNIFPRKVSYHCWTGRRWYWTGTLYLDIIVSEVRWSNHYCFFLNLHLSPFIFLSWLLLLLSRCGTLVSGDSTGSVQFWDSSHGTLLQAHSYHKGDVNALATLPSQNRVFSAGSDGQVGSITKTAIWWIN